MYVVPATLVREVGQGVAVRGERRFLKVRRSLCQGAGPRGPRGPSRFVEPEVAVRGPSGTDQPTPIVRDAQAICRQARSGEQNSSAVRRTSVRLEIDLEQLPTLTQAADTVERVATGGPANIQIACQLVLVDPVLMAAIA